MSAGAELLFPKNDDIFEDICLDLWGKLLNGNPNAQRNGRKGHKQNGVDIYGYDEKQNLIGIQAKQKDLLGNKKLSERIIRNEVEDAKTFEPPISHYIIATTARRDPKIQELTRVITEEHKDQGFFSVSVWFWEDITHELLKYPEIIKFFGLGVTIDSSEEIKSQLDRIEADNSQIKLMLEEKITTSSEISKEIPSIYKKLFKHVKKLLEDSKHDEAVIFLDNIRDEIFESDSSNAKYEFLKFKGLAKHRLFENEEAGRLLIQAYKYNQDDKNAKCNKGWGKFLLNKFNEAKGIAEELIAENPDYLNAYQILIYSSAEETFEDIINKVPNQFRETADIAYSIGIVARKKKLFDLSEDWLRIALENDSKNFIDLKGNLGEVIFSNILTNNPLIPYLNDIDPFEREKLLEAKNLLNNALKPLSTEVKKSRISWIINKSTINKILGDFDNALKDINTALDLECSNDSIVKKALIMSEKGDLGAYKLLKNINEIDLPEKQILLAKLLSDEKKYPEAIAGLEQFLKTSPKGNILKEVCIKLIELYLVTEDLDNAQRIHDFKYGSVTNDVSGLVFASIIAKNQDIPDSSLDKAVKIANINTPIPELLILSNELLNRSRYNDAAKIYQLFVNSRLYNDLTCGLVDCYYKSGDIGQALNICIKLREDHKIPLKYVSEIEIMIYLEIGDLNMVNELMTCYLKKYHANINMKINQAIVNYRSNNFEDVDKFLSSEIDLESLSLEEYINIIKLYNLRDFDQNRILELLYEMRKKFNKDLRAHAEYYKFISLTKNDFNELTTIVEDTAFCLEFPSGDKKWYVIAPNNPDITLGEISADDPIAKEALGKGLDDQIEITRFSIVEIAKIIAIKNKFEYAAGKSAEYSDLFASQGIRPLSLPQKDQLPKSSMDQESQKKETFLEYKMQYSMGQINIEVFSYHSKKNLINLWKIITSNDNLSIINQISKKAKIEETLLMLDKKPKLIIDFISLLTIFELDIQNELVESFGKLGISLSTLEYLEDYLNTLKYSVLPSSFLSLSGDVPLITDGDDDFEVKIKYLIELIEWVKKNCHILPCNKALEISRYQRNIINQVVGKMSADTLLISSEPGNILLSEEEIVRNLGYETLTTRGVWTQILIFKLLIDGKIDTPKYLEAIDKLLEHNYFFLC